jgi:hypothetical protein
MSTTLTSAQRLTVTNLVHLRHHARKNVGTKQRLDALIAQAEQQLAVGIKCGDRIVEARARSCLESAREVLLDVEFGIIRTGQMFAQIVSDVDALPRKVWLRALAVNEREWDTEDMQKYGESVLNVVSVLNLENSATRDDSITARPLNWCWQINVMNAMQVNPKLGELMHDKCNEVFGGAFGDWHEPTLMQRLGVHHA